MSECVSISNPSLPELATLCEDEWDFSAAVVIGVNAGSVNYWSTVGLGFPSTFGVYNTDIVINGTLIIDEDAGVHDCRIKLSSGAKVVILEDEFLLSLNSKWFACSGMWTGIEVNSGGMFRSFGSHFEDARYLITADDGASLTLYDNFINRNYVGIRNGVGSSNFAGILFNYFGENEFSCTSELNDESYYPPISFAGIYLDHGAMSLGGAKGTTQQEKWPHPNYFEFMSNGIVLNNSTAQITNMHFSNMLANGTPEFSGHGVALQDANLKITAAIFNNSWYGRCTFENCINVGIFSRSSSAEINSAIFSGDMAGGIEFDENTESQFVHILNCVFELDNPGTVGATLIYRGVGSGETPHYIMDSDTVEVIDVFDYTAWGLNLANRFLPALDEALIDDNYVLMQGSLEDGMTGIGIANSISHRYKVRGNTIDCASSTEGEIRQRLGIVCVGTVAGFITLGNDVSDNNILGVSTENSFEGAICLDQFNNTRVCNNSVDYSEIGLHLIGNYSHFEVTENDINRHQVGMLVEDGLFASMLGTQLRRNNVWGSSGDYDSYAALCTANPLRNRFTVQSSASGILPDPVEPSGSGWFTVAAGDLNDCGENSEVEGGLTRFDSLLIEEELFDSSTPSAVVWSAGKQLMLKLIRNSSLRPASSPAETFYSANLTESIGLHALAESSYIDALQSPQEHNYADSTYGLIQFWLDSLGVYQDYSRRIDTLAEDTSYIAHIDSLIDTLVTIIESDADFRFDIRTSQVSDLTSTMNSIKTLPSDSLFELYNKRFLNAMSARVVYDSIAGTDLLLLDTIASSSELILGTVVKSARLVLGSCSGHEVHSHPEYESESIIASSSSHDQGLVDLRMQVRVDNGGGVVRVDWNMPVSGTINIFDAMGYQVKEQVINESTSCNFNWKYPAGIYYVLFDNGKTDRLTEGFVSQ